MIVDRMKNRFGAEVILKPPRVPYQETIKSSAKAQGRYKKQTGGRGQFGDCHIEIEPLPHGGGFEFVNKIKGGVIPTGFIPAVEKGVMDAMQSGVVAGYPLRDVRVTLYDGSYHSVDSSENAFKVAGSMAFKKAAEQAQPTLLEPIMQAQVVVPEDAVGDVIGDLNGRRGRPLGMEPKGAMTEIKAEVPMAEMLNYAPDLRSITGGRGEYTMEFVRYEEVPVAPRPEGDLRRRHGGRGRRQGVDEFDAAEASGYLRRMEKVHISRMRRAPRGVRRLPSHDAEGRAGGALPDALARAAARVHAVRAPRTARRAGSARPPRPRCRRARSASPSARACCAAAGGRRRRARRPRSAVARRGGARRDRRAAGRARGRRGGAAARLIRRHAAAQPAPGEGRAHQRAAQDRARARALQRVRASPHRGRHRAHARHAARGRGDLERCRRPRWF